MARSNRKPAGPPPQLSDQKSLPKKSSIFANSAAHKAAQLLALAAIYSPISHLTMTPVYGSVPSALFHRYGLLVAALVAFLSHNHLRRYLPIEASRFIPAFCFWIPTIQFVLFKYSSVLGNPYGPLFTELLTFYPLAFLSIYTALLYFAKVDLSSYNDFIAEHGPTMGFYLFLTTVHNTAKSFITNNVGRNIMFTRLGLQLSIAALYGLAIPDAVIWPVVPSLAFTVLGNVHNPLMRTTDVLNNTLSHYNYTLLERKESLTGYISVLENTQAQFRVMRCDHSLLGGEWTMAPPEGYYPRVKEPIYAIFAMLEAVRLVETDDARPRIADSKASALNIGLGIGTVPTALISHGINTTIVELDPVVYSFAVKYFGLPRNHSIAIEDAVRGVEDIVAENKTSLYEYIIHDVFTGGAEPVELFTFEFLKGLSQLLKPDGVIAINYAGDLSLPASSYIVRTILAVFSTCRVFREGAAPKGTLSADFTNMVIFCKKMASPLKFRKPVEADYLGSGARKAYLLPKHEIPLDRFDPEAAVLKRGQVKQLLSWHAKSAVGHWRIMRTVLPDAVWENW